MIVLDLCTGISGMGLLLPPHKVALYVEKNKFCATILERRMANGCIPHAPVCSDFAQIDIDSIRQQGITHIFAGFPCQDISIIGVQAGLKEGTRSSLFYDIMRLAIDIAVPYLYLENVDGIRSNKSIWQDIITTIHASGYDLYWTTTSARDAGSPQLRKRWFALCVRSRRPAGQSLPLDSMPPATKTGKLINGKYLPVPAADHSERWSKDLHVCLTARTKYSSAAWRQKHARTPRKLKRWATPRAGMHGAARTLTLRCMRDLPTQVRFANTTPAHQKRFSESSIVCNPEWVEWLMGFPQGWTDPRQDIDTVDLYDHWGKNEPNLKLVCSRQRDVHKRLSALGNACVPQTSALAWHELSSWQNADEAN